MSFSRVFASVWSVFKWHISLRCIEKHRSLSDFSIRFSIPCSVQSVLRNYRAGYIYHIIWHCLQYEKLSKDSKGNKYLEYTELFVHNFLHLHYNIIILLLVWDFFRIRREKRAKKDWSDWVWVFKCYERDCHANQVVRKAFEE